MDYQAEGEKGHDNGSPWLDASQPQQHMDDLMKNEKEIADIEGKGPGADQQKKEEQQRDEEKEVIVIEDPIESKKEKKDTDDQSTKDQEDQQSSFTREPIQLEWKDIRFEVRVKPGRNPFKRVTKTILHDISGHAMPGESIAILGPSGSGKTSLLNILSQRNFNYSGQITVNGKKLGSRFQKHCAYVQQDDVLFPNLTVYMTIWYQAMLRLPTFMSYRDKLKRIESVLETFGLTHCKSTIVGAPGGAKGISGGERKRLACSLELLTNPSILFLDEPTSGLDAKTAANVVKSLNNLRKTGTIVIMTIHQPRSQIFSMFDKLLLLSRGKIAYFGPVSAAEEHFSSINPDWAIPKGYNAADHFIDLITETTGDSEEDRVLRAKDQERITSILDYYELKHEKEEVPKPVSDKSLSKIKVQGGSMWFMQCLIVGLRAGNNLLFDKVATIGKFAQIIVVAILMGSLYFRMSNSQAEINDRLGLYFFCMMFSIMNSLFSTLQSFSTEYPIFLREFNAGAYGITSYYFGKTVAQIPHQLFYPLLFGSFLYWTVGWNDNVGRFFVFLLISEATALCGQGIGEIISIASPKLEAGLIVAPVVILMLSFFSGFYLRVDSIPVYWLPVYYISLFKYGLESFLLNEFDGQTFMCTEKELRVYNNICPLTDGTQVLDNLSFPTKYYWVWINLGILLGLTVALKIISVILFSIRVYNIPERIKRLRAKIRAKRMEGKRSKEREKKEQEYNDSMREKTSSADVDDCKKQEKKQEVEQSKQQEEVVGEDIILEESSSDAQEEQQLVQEAAEDGEHTSNPLAVV